LVLHGYDNFCVRVQYLHTNIWGITTPFNLIWILDYKFDPFVAIANPKTTHAGQ